MRSTSPPEQRQQPAGRPPGSEASRGAVSGLWLLRAPDGRLIVFAHVGETILRWTESRPGSAGWLGPDVLPARNLSHVTVVQGENRYAHVVGRRVRDAGTHSPVVDLAYAIQYQAGRPMSEWRPIGNPHAKRERTPLMGRASAAVNADGVLHVLVPTAEGRISMRREDAQGRWEPWTDLRVTSALDTPAVVPTSTGQVEIAAPSRTGLLTWYQQSPGAVPQRGQDLGVIPLPGSVTGLETSPGRVTYYLTDVRGGMAAVRAGEWPVPLEGDPGDGRHAAVSTVLDGYPCTVLAHRGAHGRIMLGVCVAEDERNGVWWTDTGQVCLGDPVLALDGHGRLVVMAAAVDGAITLARQEDGSGLTLGGWSRI